MFQYIRDAILVLWGKVNRLQNLQVSGCPRTPPRGVNDVVEAHCYIVDIGQTHCEQYAVDKGLHGRSVLHQLLLILLCICSRLVREMLQRPFHYDDSSMYVAVGGMNYMAESIILGNSKHLGGESMGLKISDLTIVQYIDDVQLVTQ